MAFKQRIPQVKTIVSVIRAEKVEYTTEVAGPRRIDYDIFSEKARIPQTIDDVIANIDRISSKRSGRSGDVYRLPDIVKIATNLGLSSSGSKTQIVARIQAYAKAHMA